MVSTSCYPERCCLRQSFSVVPTSNASNSKAWSTPQVMINDDHASHSLDRSNASPIAYALCSHRPDSNLGFVGQLLSSSNRHRQQEKSLRRSCPRCLSYASREPIHSVSPDLVQSSRSQVHKKTVKPASCAPIVGNSHTMRLSGHSRYTNNFSTHGGTCSKLELYSRP